VRVGDELLIADLRNSIVAGNLDQSAHAPDCLGMVMSQGCNLIQSAAGCTISGASTGNIHGLSARLGPLADNGGFSPTHALLPGSPAVDAGNPLLPGSGGNSCEAVDQRGVTRPQRVACDMGAYEYVGNVYQAFLPATFCNR
jgi:hypothetical protein